jgi:hypothetical protein
MMFITLPSGRQLVYVRPRMGLNRFGSESVTYDGYRLHEEVGTHRILRFEICGEHRPEQSAATFLPML